MLDNLNSTKVAALIHYFNRYNPCLGKYEMATPRAAREFAFELEVAALRLARPCTPYGERRNCTLPALDLVQLTKDIILGTSLTSYIQQMSHDTCWERFFGWNLAVLNVISELPEERVAQFMRDKPKINLRSLAAKIKAAVDA